MKTVTNTQREAALKLVNEVRKALGKRPVKRLKKGIRNKCQLCPIARSISNTPGVVSVSDTTEGRAEVVVIDGDTFVGSKAVGSFIRNFDAGGAPDLEVTL